MGDQGFGIDHQTVARIAEEIAKVRKLDIDVAVVIGGGNIFRGLKVAAAGGDRVAGDHMGMLATVMNCLAMQSELEKMGVPARVLSAIAMPQICETFSQRTAINHMQVGRVMLFAAGTGNPFFTTDSGAALRAAEMGCDVLLKGTQVDGVYSADPQKDPDAVRFDRLTHTRALELDLKVMDTAAIALARDNGIPIIVFSIHEDGSLLDVVNGEGRATIVAD